MFKLDDPSANKENLKRPKMEEKQDEAYPNAIWEFEAKLDSLVKLEEDKETINPDLLHRIEPSAKRAKRKLPPLVPIQNIPSAPWESQFEPQLEPLVKLDENNETINAAKMDHQVDDKEETVLVIDTSYKENQPRKRIAKKNRQLSRNRNKSAHQVVDTNGFVINAPYMCAKCNCPFQKETTWYSHYMKC